jgi:protein-S-isoprenylcysteine O-methyltransferase Ste14
MIKMLPYATCAALWLGIVFLWLIPVVRKRIVYEVYAACGLGVMFSLLVLGNSIFERGHILPLVYLGYAFCVLAAVFVVFSFLNLKHKGEAGSGWEHTTKLIEGGVYRIVRHPLYLGGALLTMGMILLLQSLLLTIFGAVAIACFWLASKKEDEFNLKKFGDSYGVYLKKVPMWNFLKIAKK